MQELYEKLLNADIIVFATPVYFYTVNSQTKAVMDRTFAIEKTMKNKTAYLITSGAAPEEKYMEIIIETFKKYIGCFENIKFGGYVIGCGTSNIGDIENNPALEKAFELGKQIH